MGICQTLSRINVFELCESLALLESRHSWRETLSSKFVGFG